MIIFREITKKYRASCPAACLSNVSVRMITRRQRNIVHYVNTKTNRCMRVTVPKYLIFIKITEYCIFCIFTLIFNKQRFNWSCIYAMLSNKKWL